MKWLREQVAQRMETAKEACHDGDGNWWRRLRALYVGREPIPDGALYEGTPEVDDPEHDIFLAEIVVYDEGRPSDQQFAHIALNDPQDVIARCEAELAIITRCESVHAAFADPAGGLWPDVTRRERSHAFATLADLASSYKHREGYAEHWSEGR